MEVKKESDVEVVNFGEVVIKQESVEIVPSTSDQFQDESETFDLDYLLNADKKNYDHKMNQFNETDEHFREKIRRLRQELTDYYGEAEPTRINNELYASERLKFEEAMARGNVYVMPGRLRVTKYPFNLLSSRPMKCVWFDNDGTTRTVEMSGKRGNVRVAFIEENRAIPSVNDASLVEVVTRRKFKDDATANALLEQHYANSKSKRPNFPNVVQQLCESAKYVEQPVVVVADPNTVISTPQYPGIATRAQFADYTPKMTKAPRYVPYKVKKETKTLGDLVNGMRRVNPNMNVHQFLVNRLNNLKNNPDQSTNSSSSSNY